MCNNFNIELTGAGYSKITYERALRAVKCNLDKCSVSETLIALPKPHLRSSRRSNLRSLICWPITSQFTQLLANHNAAFKAHRKHLTCS